MTANDTAQADDNGDNNASTALPLQQQQHAEKAWEFYRSMGSPRWVAAPMVDQSELPFRLLCRRYGTELAYSPMVHAACYLREKKSKRNEAFFCNSAPGDWPLIAQLCGNDPAILLAAAKEICQIKEVCAVDLNLGCPQGIARKGKYGAFLLDKKDLLVEIVSTLSQGLDKPVTCKIRLLPRMEDTLALCHALVKAGCSLLCVHGRTKEQNKHLVGQCDWEKIKIIKEALPIPVFANGGIADLDDAERCIAETGVDGVMSSEALLENPGLFSRNIDPHTGKEASQDDLVAQYLELVDQHPLEKFKCVRAHIFKMMFTGLQVPQNHDLRDKLVVANYVEMREVVEEMRKRREADPSIAGRSWYWRHWGGGAGGGGEGEGNGQEGECEGGGENGGGEEGQQKGNCGGGEKEDHLMLGLGDGEDGGGMCSLFGGEDEDDEGDYQ